MYAMQKTNETACVTYFDEYEMFSSIKTKFTNIIFVVNLLLKNLKIINEAYKFDYISLSTIRWA